MRQFLNLIFLRHDNHRVHSLPVVEDWDACEPAETGYALAEGVSADAVGGEPGGVVARGVVQVKPLASLH